MTKNLAPATLFLLAILLALLVPAGPALAEDETTPASPTARFFRQYDADDDGRLSRAEFPAFLLAFFGEVDLDQDGFITPLEDKAYRTRAKRRGPGAKPARLPETAHTDLSYGPDERNLLDIWLPKTRGTHPLVVYFHGGGFRAGDKRTLSPALLKGLLDAGFTVAAANYRLTQTATYPAQMHDAARAVQWLRANASTYGIDPDRIGATGGSAGAGISLWLGYHDDLADPESEDPVLRASSRVQAMVVYGAQSSYDPRVFRELFGTTDLHGAMLPFYGLERVEDVDDPRFHPLFEDASPITHVGADDAPAYLYYSQADTPLRPNAPERVYIHHPKFGHVLKAKCDQVGLPCTVRLRKETGGRVPLDEYVAFFREHLGAPEQAVATTPEDE